MPGRQMKVSIPVRVHARVGRRPPQHIFGMDASLNLQRHRAGLEPLFLLVYFIDSVFLNWDPVEFPLCRTWAFRYEVMKPNGNYGCQLWSCAPPPSVSMFLRKQQQRMWNTWEIHRYKVLTNPRSPEVCRPPPPPSSTPPCETVHNTTPSQTRTLYRLRLSLHRDEKKKDSH